ncbi:MAG TPA: ribose-phosphate pyrophosphokinase, partial [Coxiellaceae bacterium]|nr:ribose-phosphate pyrophosphokinase [Coxiellaceae bacterium]
TICHAAAALKKKGARSVTVYGTHPVLSCNAIDNIEKSEITEVVVTDTIPLSSEAENCKKIRQLSISAILAETIRRVDNKRSVSSLFPE